MARVFAVILFAAAVIAIAGYIHFSAKDYEIRISETQMQAKLNEKLPLSKTYLYIFELTLDNPRIELLEESGRIRAGLDLELNIKIGGHREPLAGSVDASGLLHYVPNEGNFYLAEPNIERLELQGLPEKYADQARTVIITALTEYYASHPVYRLKAGDIKQAAARLVLKRVTVSGDTLVITMGL